MPRTRVTLSPRHHSLTLSLSLSLSLSLRPSPMRPQEIATYNKERHNELLLWRELAEAREADLRAANALLRGKLEDAKRRRYPSLGPYLAPI